MTALPFKYLVTKTYDHSEGLSVAFRQYKADTHCNQLHGYALSIKLTFGSNTLDGRNWAGIGFGDLREFKQWLKHMFDHTTIIDKADPEVETFQMLSQRGLVQLRLVERVGCESFAELIFDTLSSYMDQVPAITATLVSVEVREHSANSAIYNNPKLVAGISPQPTN